MSEHDEEASAETEADRRLRELGRRHELVELRDLPLAEQVIDPAGSVKSFSVQFPPSSTRAAFESRVVV